MVVCVGVCGYGRGDAGGGGVVVFCVWLYGLRAVVGAALLLSSVVVALLPLLLFADCCLPLPSPTLPAGLWRRRCLSLREPASPLRPSIAWCLFVFHGLGCVAIVVAAAVFLVLSQVPPSQRGISLAQAGGGAVAIRDRLTEKAPAEGEKSPPKVCEMKGGVIVV